MMDTAESTNNTLPVERLIRAMALAVSYILVWVMLSHAINALNQAISVDLWIPCAGLTLAILLEYGGWALPLPLLAALLAGWPTWPEGRWLHGLAASLAPLLGYLVAAYLLRYRPNGGRPGEWRFDDPRQVATFLGVTMLGTLFVALARAPLLQAAGLSPAGLPWLGMVWYEWIGAFIGVATFAPLVLIFVAPLARRFVLGESLFSSHLPSPPISARLRVLQGGLSVALLAVLLWVPCPQWLGQSYPFVTLLLLPMLTWVAATQGVRGTAPTVLLYQLGIMALVADQAQPDQAFQYQIAMVAIAASGLLTSAVSQARLADVARFRDLAEISNDLLWEFDQRGRLCDLRGYLVRTVKAADGQLGRYWQDYIQPEQRTDLARLQAAIQQRQRFQQLVLCVRLPGSKTPIWTRNSGLPLFDDSGQFRGYRGTTTDISDHRQVEMLREQTEILLHDYDQKLEAQVEARVVERTRMLEEASLRNWQLANFDSLTGLPNRNLFFEHLRKSLQQSRRQWRLMALLLVDLDGFKQVNDTFGHEMGDELLRQVAARLRQSIRATDTAARLGGDEFTIVLTDLEQAEAAEAVARKLVASLAEPVPLGEASATVTASVGIALYRPEWPANLEQAMALLRQADAAMYEAKRAGKNAWRFAEPPTLESE
ncbi:MAG: diguanylate cyclase [Gammaproteobacteria bacterium]|nr:diguanylate cyclase [Gammaproteobacteria bacterium]